jgi:tight adherence protein B
LEEGRGEEKEEEMTSPLVLGGLFGVFVSLVLFQMLGVWKYLAGRASVRYARRVLESEEEERKKSQLGALLKEAGVSLSPASFYGVSLLVGCFAFLLGSAFGFPLLVCLLASGVGFYSPLFFVKERLRRRRESVERELPKVLGRVSALCKIESDVLKILSTLSESLPRESVLGELLRATAAKMEMKGADALKELEEESPSPSLSSFALSLRIFHEAGGEFSHLLAESANRARRIVEGRNTARAKASEALFASRALPFLLIFASFFLARDPEFLRFYRSTVGGVLLALVATLMFIGYIVIRRSIMDVA